MMEDKENCMRRWNSRSYSVGATSSFLSTLVTFPIYKTVFRQQLHGSSIGEALRQLSQEGLRRFYRGIFPPLLSRTLQGTVMFGSYDSFLCLLTDQASGPYSVGNQATAGLLSGFLEAFVLSPFERVQNILQDGRKVQRFPTTPGILREFNSYAAMAKLTLGYYRGLGLVLVRNGLGSALYFSVKDPLCACLSQGGLSHWLQALLAGSMSGTLISLLLYPLSVLIANVQAQVGKQETLGLQASVAAVWGSHGKKVTRLYRGGSLLILRSCLTWGLTTAIYDFLQEGRG
ncbi:solute carrier family 25 member 53 [Tiliqua scincoides]|uniref:solute carrier family 25 member 53 n=1 Tax=Tiliqua scincoides TaxID=71010 RepID=UPI00346364B1